MTNIVVNPDFETNFLMPWIAFGHAIFVSGAVSHSGKNALSLGTKNNFGSISQTLITIPTKLYQLSYWVLRQGDDDPNNYFSAIWNGIEIPDSILSNPTNNIYVNYKFLVVATSNKTVLTFRQRNDLNYWRLDDISVILEPKLSNFIKNKYSGYLNNNE